MGHILDINVPERNPAGAPGGDYERIDSSAIDFGGSVGQATEKLGGAIGQAAETGMNALVARQQLTNEVHANEKLTWMADQGTDTLEKFRSLEGKAAVMQLPKLKSDLTALRDQALQGESPAVQAQLSRGVASLVDRYYSMASGHASTQERAWHDKTATDSARTWGTQAALASQAGTWDDVDSSLGKSDQEITKLFEQRQYEPQAIAAEVAKNRGANVSMVVKTLADSGDVRTAQAVFDRNRSRMDGASILQTTAALRSVKAQLDGRDLADEESGHVLPKADSVAGVPSSFVAQVKRTEGFAPTAKWDVKQFSNGYGTKAKFEGEQISKEEADQRFETEFGKALKIVDSVNPNLDPGTRAAMGSLTYNAGADWVNAGLGDKIRAGDLAGAKQAFLQYNKAGGETNDGLVARRYREAQWFGASEAPAGNAPLVDKQTAYERVLARTDSDPLLQTAAMARLNQVYSIYHTEQATQNASFDLRLQDSQAEAMATGAAKAPLTEPDFVNRYGVTDGQRQYGDYQKNLALGADIAGLATMSPAEQAALLTKHTPQPGSEGFADEQKRQAQIQKAILHTAKERDDDPAAFALRRLPAAQAAFNDFNKAMSDPQSSPQARQAGAAQFAAVMLSEQARVGVAADDRRIVPQPYIDHLNATLTAPDKEGGTGQVAQKIQAEAALWGKNWPEVYKQLSKEAAPVVRVIGSGVQSAAAQALVDLAPLSLSAILKDQDTEKNATIKKDVLDAFKPLATSMAGNDGATGLFNDFRGQAEKLAAKYVIGGATTREAAAKAFDQLVGFKYTFQNGYRVPKDSGVDPDAVAQGSVVALRDLDKIGIKPAADTVGGLTPEYLQQGKIASLQRDGKWVTSPDEKGLMLVHNDQAVRRADGQALVLTWKQLGDLAAPEQRRVDSDFNSKFRMGTFN